MALSRRHSALKLTLHTLHENLHCAPRGRAADATPGGALARPRAGGRGRQRARPAAVAAARLVIHEVGVVLALALLGPVGAVGMRVEARGRLALIARRLARLVHVRRVLLALLLGRPGPALVVVVLARAQLRLALVGARLALFARFPAVLGHEAAVGLALARPGPRLARALLVDALRVVVIFLLEPSRLLVRVAAKEPAKRRDARRAEQHERRREPERRAERRRPGATPEPRHGSAAVMAGAPPRTQTRICTAAPEEEDLDEEDEEEKDDSCGVKVQRKEGAF